MSATLKIPAFHPRQVELLTSTARYVAYGGARGGGKSFVARWKCIFLCMAHPGIEILALRRTLPELKKNFAVPMITALKGIAVWRESDSRFIFPNGSVIYLGYCANEKDALIYQGQEYDCIFMDEATQFTQDQFIWISSALRTTKPNMPHRMYFMCNPGGVGHAWVKRLFIDRDYRAGENPEDYVFIPAKATDNRTLAETDPKYLDWLDALPSGIREAWRDGSWDVFAGQYFPEFSVDRHVATGLVIPPHWRRYVTMDYGLDMLAVLWIAVDEHNKAHVYRELYRSDTIVSEAARLIALASAGECIQSFLAPPDLWHRHSDSGQSTADIFLKNGISLVMTGNDRISGWRAVKERLAAADGPDGIVVDASCKNLIRCLPLLQHDRIRTEDVADTPHEITHAPDALRGFCVTFSMAAVSPRVKAPDPFGLQRAPSTGVYGYGARIEPF